MIPFWLGALVKMLVLPPMGPLLVGVIGLAVMTWRARTGRVLVIVGIAATWLFATPAISALLVRYLDDSPPLDLASARRAQAIVILGGGTRKFAAEYGGATINAITLERVRYGARLARATHLPILVSGGSSRGRPAESLLMRDVLTSEFSIPVRWIETRSRNTHENAVESAKILEANGVRSVILVGHSFDFPRSRREFEAAGIDVIPAPIAIPPAAPAAVGDFIPSAQGMLESYYACYELLGNALFDITHALSGSSADTRSTPRSSSPPPPGS